MERGPVEVLVVTFPLSADPFAVSAALRQPVEQGVLSVLDLALLLRTPGGTLEVRDADHEAGLPAEWADLATDPRPLLSDEDLALVAEALPPDQHAAVVVLEHLWSRQAVAQVAAAGGELALYVRVPTPDAEAAIAAAG